MVYYCDECNSKMKKVDKYVLVCPNCKHSVEIEDYGHENAYDEYSNNDDIIDIPFCCRACGGPYPACISSCKIFDD